MKNGLLKGKVFRNNGEAVATVAFAAGFYNNRRPHMSIGMKNPAEAPPSCRRQEHETEIYRHEAIKSGKIQEMPENYLPSCSLPACGLQST